MTKNKRLETDQPKFRQFSIMQYFNNPKTNEYLWDENKIKKGTEYKSIKRWAYAIHDKDVYTEEDEAKDLSGETKAGDKKGIHAHVAIQCSPALTISQVAKWFEVPSQFVEVVYDKGAFLDLCEYMTHEHEKQQALGKYLYPDETVKSNVDWRAELTLRQTNRAKYGGDLTEGDRFLIDVKDGNKTLREVEEENPLYYAKNHKKLEDLRGVYLSKVKQPPIRLNVYVTGEGGMGKGVTSMAMARSLYPNLTDDREIFFVVGGTNVSFEGYDGQPVIIWNDFRSGDLINTLGSRGKVFDVFDPFPQLQQRQNIKYGSINLVNAVNIVNSVQPYEEFFNGLAGTYIDRNGQQHYAEDKNQAFRRFQMIGMIKIDSFDLLLNKGFFEGTKEFETFYNYSTLKTNFAELKKRLSLTPEIARQAEVSMLAPVLKSVKDKYKEASSRQSDRNMIPQGVLKLIGATTEEEEETIKKEWSSYIEMIRYFIETEEEYLFNVLPENWRGVANFKDWAARIVNSSWGRLEDWGFIVRFDKVDIEPVNIDWNLDSFISNRADDSSFDFDKDAIKEIDKLMGY